ncbi:hypothetical protein GCM10025865_06260 [Paraoerskovia sediminicola]|uniref:Uncharacterized protein n=1 Tax=Paraoerskovia sediminicola TaxID=1138587 RepID=A0ABM8G025_9CELL|nr:hypothetical protein GCM10025865_06260 [Paraoerskovia sediminicola]
MLFLRRTIALVVLAAVLAAVVAGVVVLVRAFDGSGTEALPEMAAAEKQAPPTPQPLGAPVTCGPDDVEVSIDADASEYVAPRRPLFTVTVRHVGRTPCLVESSAVGRPVTITSGDARTWSSADCSTEERTILMARGDVDEQKVRWDRVPSADGCPDPGDPADPGTYQAVAALAGVDGTASEPVRFTLEAKPEPKPTPSSTPSSDESDDSTDETDKPSDEADKSSDETEEPSDEAEAAEPSDAD